MGVNGGAIRRFAGAVGNSVVGNEPEGALRGLLSRKIRGILSIGSPLGLSCAGGGHLETYSQGFAIDEIASPNSLVGRRSFCADWTCERPRFSEPRRHQVGNSAKERRPAAMPLRCSCCL